MLSREESDICVERVGLNACVQGAATGSAAPLLRLGWNAVLGAGIGVYSA